MGTSVGKRLFPRLKDGNTHVDIPEMEVRPKRRLHVDALSDIRFLDSLSSSLVSVEDLATPLPLIHKIEPE